MAGETVWESRWTRRGARAGLLGLAFAIACAPLFRDGFPLGHDWILELVRVAEYQAALAAGQLPPAWSENLYAGYGSPVFLFYAPLFCAAASPLAWLLDSVAAGAALLLVLLTAASVWTARGFFERACTGTEGASPSSARLAAAAARVGVYVYVLHPYLLGDKLLRNASAEFAALCLAPLALEGVLLADTRPRRAFVQVSLGLSLVILSHNLTALVVVSLVLGAGLVVHSPRRRRATWGLLAAAIAFALVLTAFFWLPAVSLTSLVRSQDLLAGKFDFHSQFPGFFEVFGYDRFFATGLVTPAVWLVAGVAVFRLGDDPRRRLLVAGLGAGFGFWFLLTREILSEISCISTIYSPEKPADSLSAYL